MWQIVVVQNGLSICRRPSLELINQQKLTIYWDISDGEDEASLI